MALSLAIVGRPNVGKSTLFNRIAGARIAIVHDTPGVTRDRAHADAVFHGLSLRLIDTAGYEATGTGETLSARMTAQAAAAIEEAEAILFVIDARAGITAGDETIASTLHKTGKPVILAANKCEGRINPEALAGVFGLGFGTPLALSAEHALGMADLAEALAGFVADEAKDREAETPALAHRQKPLRLALVGRPNVGKSSLFNRLLGQDRALTGPEAGLTRDAIAAPWRIDNREVLLHDTAGLRKKAKAAGQALEEMSVASALTAVRFADCVVLVLEAGEAFEKQDLAIADLIAGEGRAIVLAVNKWDLVEPRPGAIMALRERCDRLLPQVAGAELVALSARTGEGLNRLPHAILAADRVWNTHLPTAQLNRFLEEALARHAPPAIKGRRVRIRYMTQPKIRPPTFALFGNQLGALPEDYRRYLVNSLRKGFGLNGTPIRL
ncbi:MAG: ribosome biogenesis GTPase Der, partial [Rhizomicrobium sp.]